MPPMVKQDSIDRSFPAVNVEFFASRFGFGRFGYFVWRWWSRYCLGEQDIMRRKVRVKWLWS